MTSATIQQYAVAIETEYRRRRLSVSHAPAKTFRQFIERVAPWFVWYDHCVKAAAVLQRVADDELDRVIVMWPPRHSKTELFTRLFPAYYLYRHPDRWIGLASYAAALAHKLSRAARDFARIGGVTLRSDADAVSEWETTAGGGLWAAGVGGPATGKGMNLGLLDDPVKNAEEAASAVVAERNQEWWASTWYTRQEPGAALVVVTTRWPGPGDFVGWLFEQEGADDLPERWHVMAAEAEKTDEAYEVPASCTLEPDTRKPGEALCPERYPIDKLRKIASRIGSYFYRSLFQQRKSNREGSMFKWVWWQELAAVPVVTSIVRYWDLAGTEPSRKGHDPDYTASTLAGRMTDQRAAIMDVTAFRESIGKRDTTIEETARADKLRFGTRVVWWFEEEAGVGGKDRTALLVRRIQAIGLAVHTEPATGSKLFRAEPLAAAAEAGNVCLSPDSPTNRWHERFRAHMADFSAHCEHDDIADSAAGAYSKLSEPRGTWGTSQWSM